MLNKLRDKIAFYLLKTIYGEKVDYFCSFYGRDLNCESRITDSESIGIVFQGPVIDESKLGEGLAQYRQLLPRSPIVISTWKNSVKSDFKDYIRKLEVYCVESAPPDIGGIMNVNRQILSTANGIAYLVKQWNPDIIIKARTDYFPWRPDKAISQMRNGESIVGGEGRIWGVDFNTRMDLPFSFSDIFQIGRAKDMQDYWINGDLYPEEISVQRFLELTENQNNIASILQLQPAEIYLARRYLSSKGCALDFGSLSDYKIALAHKFGILDSQYIELAFGKYSLAEPGYEPVDRRSKRYVNSQDWLSLVIEHQ
jgi:WavE lipopolysaccharide synthesis